MTGLNTSQVPGGLIRAHDLGGRASTAPGGIRVGFLEGEGEKEALGQVSEEA